MRTDLSLKSTKINSNLEMSNLLDKTNEPLTSKHSSETILIERDCKNQLNATSNLIPVNNEESISNQIDVQIVDPKKRAKKAKKSAQTPLSRPEISPTRINQQQSQQQALSPDDDENIEQIEEELILKYGAQHVIKLFIPVTICLMFVIISLSLITSYQKSGGATLLYTPFNENSQPNSTKLWMSIANASIFICVVVIMTVILILLYKFHCYKIIHGWLAFSSLMLLFFFTYMFIGELFKRFNIVTDMITISILLWNFGILGMFCIHWKGPLFLQQIFLIFSCVQMALIFIKYLPEWTTWVLLAFISIWDLIAVLCPFGPLRILVETARSRNDNLFPAMVYSSAIMYTIMANLDPSGETQSNSPNRQMSNGINQAGRDVRNGGAVNDIDDDGGFKSEKDHLPSNKRISNRVGGNDMPEETVRNRHHGMPASNIGNNQSAAVIEHIEQLEQQQEDEQENGVKLGLGDFIFYSILVGKASILGDWNTVIACFLAILIGLCFTLVLLAIYHKPLPALPISLLFGLIFYFLTNLIVRPFYDMLTYNQFFI